MNWFSSIEMSTESPAHNRFGSKYAENGRINDQKKVPDKAATRMKVSAEQPRCTGQNSTGWSQTQRRGKSIWSLPRAYPGLPAMLSTSCRLYTALPITHHELVCSLNRRISFPWKRIRRCCCPFRQLWLSRSRATKAAAGRLHCAWGWTTASRWRQSCLASSMMQTASLSLIRTPIASRSWCSTCASSAIRHRRLQKSWFFWEEGHIREMSDGLQVLLWVRSGNLEQRISYEVYDSTLWNRLKSGHLRSGGAFEFLARWFFHWDSVFARRYYRIIVSKYSWAIVV